MKSSQSLFGMCFLCLVVSCRPSIKPNSGTASEEILAQVGETTITLADYRSELERQAGGRFGTFGTALQRDALLQEIINREAVLDRAKGEGFDATPAMRQLIRDLIVNRYLEEHLSEPTLPTTPSDTEIEREYEQHGERFEVPEQVRFAVIQFNCSPKATTAKQAEVLEQANQLRSRAELHTSAADSFAQLAQRYSEDQATRYLGGDAGWVFKGRSSRWNSAVTDAAFALREPGDLAQVVRTDQALYLVKLLERKSATRRPLSEVRAIIAQQLAARRNMETATKFFEKARAGLTIKINRSLLESFPAPSHQTEAVPPTLPAG